MRQFDGVDGWERYGWGMLFSNQQDTMGQWMYFAILGLSAEEPDLSVGAIHHARKQAVRHVIAGGVRPHLVTKISLHGLR